MGTLRTAIVLGSMALLATLIPTLPAVAAPAYLIIINPGNPTDTVTRQFVAEAFLKKVTRWPQDTVIKPVDLRPDSPTRRKFSEEVVGRPLLAVKNYWQQRIFSGDDVPPPEFNTDEEVVDYVLKHGEAIGYVSSTSDIHGAKTLTVK